jgi:hypothetical protein
MLKILWIFLYTVLLDLESSFVLRHMLAANSQSGIAFSETLGFVLTTKLAQVSYCSKVGEFGLIIHEVLSILHMYAYPYCSCSSCRPLRQMCYAATVKMRQVVFELQNSAVSLTTLYCCVAAYNLNVM